jgi:plastocyanin
MSDEIPTPDDESAAGTTAAPAAPDASQTAGPVATLTEAPVAVAHPSPPAEPVTFRSKFLAPLLVPIGVAATILFYVLNVSRVFLASEGALAVTYAAIITVAILAGGSALAAAPKLRSSSLTLILGGGFLLLLMGGLISIGAASPKIAGGPVQCAPIKQKLTITAGVNNTLTFTPNTPTAKAGCIQITFVIAFSSHSFQFDDPTAANAFQQLNANQKTWAGILPAGKWAFHCTVDGHAAAGMTGTLTVTS